MNFNSGSDLIACLESLRSQVLPLHEIIVVDNASTDQSLTDAVSRFPFIVVLENDANLGFAAAANQGANAAAGDILLFANPDVAFSPDCASAFSAQLAEHPGVVGPSVAICADSDDRYGCTIDWLGYPAGLKVPGRPLYIAGSALATSRDLFRHLGGFDERYFMFVEDVDYCWRVLLAGGEVATCPAASATHRGGGSAPGGYVRSGRLETSTFRFSLRERNTLAMLLKCAPAGWLVWLIPAHMAKSAVIVAGALIARQPRIGLGVVRGLLWNLCQLPNTFRLRRGTKSTKQGRRAALERIHRGLFALEQLRRSGLPEFVDN